MIRAASGHVGGIEGCRGSGVGVEGCQVSANSQPPVWSGRHPTPNTQHPETVVDLPEFRAF
ncbi:MAG: hypothetical protein HC895_27265 [Leptolyngbyaceae cyanobacterium SM1_3_5]|nr:hypothetical protein [Leptolyngbyaceae cyanobacterium SM1_3_5]